MWIRFVISRSCPLAKIYEKEIGPGVQQSVIEQLRQYNYVPLFYL